MKYRAIKLDHGNYAWPGEAVTRKCRILDVVYNPTNKEFVRTNTIVKGNYFLFSLLDAIRSNRVSLLFDEGFLLKFDRFNYPN